MLYLGTFCVHLFFGLHRCSVQFAVSICRAGAFKYALFSSLPGEMIQFDYYFSNALKPSTSCNGFGILNDSLISKPCENSTAMKDCSGSWDSYLVLFWIPANRAETLLHFTMCKASSQETTSYANN